MKTAAKVFLILGMVSAVSTFYYTWFFGIIYTLLSLFIGFMTYRKLNTASSKHEIIGWGIASLIIVNIIAGILILCLKDSDFNNSYETTSISNLETKLNELDKLRKVGTITEDEYQELRKKLLGGEK